MKREMDNETKEFIDFTKKEVKSLIMNILTKSKYKDDVYMVTNIITNVLVNLMSDTILAMNITTSNEAYSLNGFYHKKIEEALELNLKSNDAMN